MWTKENRGRYEGKMGDVGAVGEREHPGVVRAAVRGPKSAPVDGVHEPFGVLTTEANAIVAPIHPKAMPVILTTPTKFDLWLEAEVPDALALQRPLSDEALRIVAKGEKEDGPAAVAV
jgi:putative SOS response-associated peptidase YedK